MRSRTRSPAPSWRCDPSTWRPSWPTRPRCWACARATPRWSGRPGRWCASTPGPGWTSSGYGQRDPGEALAQFGSLEGLERLDGAIAEGRGVILLTAHAGNYELGGLLLRARGLQIHAVYKPDRFEAVERLRERLRNQGGVVGLPVDGVGFSTLPLVKLLREGQLVGMQGDRDFSLNGVAVPFFGREVPFPRGPWELAAMTGAPIVTSFFYTDEAGRFHARFGEPIHLRGGRGERMAEIEAGLRAYVADLEALIRRHPSQWYCFYPFWDDPLRT